MKYHQHPTHRSKAYKKRCYPPNFPTHPLDQSGESTAASSSKEGKMGGEKKQYRRWAPQQLQFVRREHQYTVDRSLPWKQSKMTEQDDKASAVMTKSFSKLGTWQGSRKHFLKRKPHLNKPTPPHLHPQVGVPFLFTPFVQTTTNKGEQGRKGPPNNAHRGAQMMSRTLARRPVSAMSRSSAASASNVLLFPPLWNPREHGTVLLQLSLLAITLPACSSSWP